MGVSRRGIGSLGILLQHKSCLRSPSVPHLPMFSPHPSFGCEMQTPVHIHPDVLSDELQSRRVTLETHVPQIAEVLCFNQCPNACLFSEHLCISCCQLTAKNYQIDFSFMFRPPTCIRNCKPLAARLLIEVVHIFGDKPMFEFPTELQCGHFSPLTFQALEEVIIS